MSLSTDGFVTHSTLSTLWKIKASPRVIAFGWTALLGGILTMDNLRKRHQVLVNACPMCLAEESIDHLLLNSKMSPVIVEFCPTVLWLLWPTSYVSGSVV